MSTTNIIDAALPPPGPNERARTRRIPASGDPARVASAFISAPLALVAAVAGLGAAGLSLSIALLMGQQLPTITPGRALTTAIPVEQVLVPLGIAVAWMEFGRFRVLARR